MSRGLISGAAVGGLLGCLGLAVASQLAPPPGAPWPAPAPAGAEGADEGGPRPAAGIARPAAGPVPAGGSAPSTTAAADLAPRPRTDGGASTPDPGDDPLRASVGAATDLSPPPGSEFARPLPDAAPVLPGGDPRPKRLVVPSVAPPPAGEALAPDTASAARPQPQPLEPAAPVAPEAAEAAAPSLPAAARPLAVRPAAATAPGAPGTEARPAAADLPPPPPLTPEEEAMLAEAAAGAPAVPRRLEPDAPEVPGTPPSTRLPRIGDAEPGTPPGITDVVPGTPPPTRLPRIGDAEPATPPADLPPLRRFARPFENPAGKPRLAILMLDTGGSEVDRAALARLPFPVSFVLDPTAPDAASAAATYRAAGQEVLMLAPALPEGATPADAEVTLEAAALALPQAVALVDRPGGGFQGARALSGQVVAILAAQGRGLVTHDQGLNAADQVARREGLPTATVFRRIGGGEDAAAVRRALDRAAFRAAQEGQATVLAETGTQTAKALVEWSVEGRADGLALAPASAMLR